MTIEERKQQILASMTALRKPTYANRDMLDELLKFKEEVIRGTFAREHAERLHFEDVLSHLESLDVEAGGVATEQIASFSKMTEAAGKLLATSISGNAGEEKVSRTLQTLTCPNNVFRNVELTVGEQTCEIDFVVITPKAIFCIEVKNTKNDTLIDINGNLVRASDGKMYDCNLGDAVRQREYMLRSLFAHSGICSENQLPDIKSYVVSANSRINFTNYFRHINSCCVTGLPFIIEEYCKNSLHQDLCIEMVSDVICQGWIERTYPVGFDVEAFRQSFAEIVATLELAKCKAQENFASIEAHSIHNEDAFTQMRETAKASVSSSTKTWALKAWVWFTTSPLPRYASCVAVGALAGSAITTYRNR